MSLKAKPKKCSFCGNMRPLWRSKPPTCKFCDRGNSESSETPKQRKRINPISKKGKEQMDRDTAFYEEIWNERPHSCEECGCNLGDNWKRYMFSHLITKGAHPELRYDKRNISLSCLPCHTRYETGDRKGMRVYEKCKDIIVQLLRESAEYYRNKK